ncbi:MAG: DUF6484 domain-containing protein [Desulfobacteraceae bacterium]|nr:DUF6484 domain-containing protein [Desulfobacteraceae bacterium]
MASNISAKIVSNEAFEGSAAIGTRIGHIVAVRAPDMIQVDFQGNPHGPLPAQATLLISEAHLHHPVVLVFENSDLRRPIIVGLIQQQPVATQLSNLAELSREEIIDIRVDGEKLILDAKKEIEIRCGQSSLIMTADGKVVIKGEQITSRARRTNKVKGGAVRIN